jgi:hypothetical protein
VTGWEERVIRARFLVAGLGESAAPPWWRTQALTAVGLRMFERLYPRTAVAAGLETAGRAARIVHDERIGRNGAYHLFRLPVADEAVIREALGAPEAVVLLRELAGLGDLNARLEALELLVGDDEVPSGQGPLYLGNVRDVRNFGTLRQICAAYVGALRTGTPTYPYLDGEAG